MYWPLNTPKQIKNLPLQLQQNVCKAAIRSYFYNPHTQLRIFGKMVLTMTTFGLVDAAIWFGQWPQPIRSCVGYILFILPVWIAASERLFFVKQCAHELLVRAILPASCFNCHYNLTGSSPDQCPECGTPLVPNPQELCFQSTEQVDHNAARLALVFFEGKRATCFILVYLLVYLGIVFQDYAKPFSFQQIRQKWEVDAQTALPVGTPLLAVEQWFGPKLWQARSFDSDQLVHVNVTESPGGLFYRPTSVTVVIDDDDRVRSIETDIKRWSLPLTFKDPTRKLRRLMFHTIPLILPMTFGFWAIWKSSRQPR